MLAKFTPILDGWCYTFYFSWLLLSPLHSAPGIELVARCLINTCWGNEIDKIWGLDHIKLVFMLKEDLTGLIFAFYLQQVTWQAQVWLGTWTDEFTLPSQLYFFLPQPPPSLLAYPCWRNSKKPFPHPTLQNLSRKHQQCTKEKPQKG
jgi:hypothetical protein